MVQLGGRRPHCLDRRTSTFAARLNLRAMRKGDAVLFYHSVEGKEVVGIAKEVAELRA